MIMYKTGKPLPYVKIPSHLSLFGFKPNFHKPPLPSRRGGFLYPVLSCFQAQAFFSEMYIA